MQYIREARYNIYIQMKGTKMKLEELIKAAKAAYREAVGMDTHAKLMQFRTLHDVANDSRNVKNGVEYFQAYLNEINLKVVS